MRTLASYHFGRVITRTLLFMSAEFVFDPRPNSNHFAENHTLGNVNFLFTNFGLFSCCIYRLKKSVLAALATNQEDLNEETERNQKKLRNFRTFLTKLNFS